MPHNDWVASQFTWISLCVRLWSQLFGESGTRGALAGSRQSVIAFSVNQSLVCSMLCIRFSGKFSTAACGVCCDCRTACSIVNHTCSS
mmetsp:Transcript_27866/g.44641  ORF Transcript_27866/g.44641 Transcript_27866/m.44641 type:complete len:88 (+) Transcript_27866:700-963(+)